MHVRSVVTDHKHTQNVGFLAGFLPYLLNTAVSRYSPFYFHASLWLNLLILLTSLLVVCSAKLRDQDRLHAQKLVYWLIYSLSFEHSCFRTFYFHACVMAKLLVLLTNQLEASRPEQENSDLVF